MNIRLRLVIAVMCVCIVSALLIFTLRGFYVQRPHILTVSPVVLPKDDWKIYQNLKYRFEFRYPKDFVGDTDDGILMSVLAGDTWRDEASQIVISPSSTPDNEFPAQFEITVHDRSNLQSDNYGDPPGFWVPSLEKLMPTIHALAQKDEPVGSLTVGTLAGQPAYQFPVWNNIGWNGSGRAIDQENLWVFLEGTSTVLEISLPNTPQFREILKTIEFPLAQEP